MSHGSNPDHDGARSRGCLGAASSDGTPGLSAGEHADARRARDASIGASAQEVAATRARVGASVAPARRVAMGWAHQLGR